jgi:hypothetical protein
MNLECRGGPVQIIWHLKPTEPKETEMPDDQTLATILAICDLMKRGDNGVQTAIGAYERAMKEVLEYRRSVGETEVGGLPVVR